MKTVIDSQQIQSRVKEIGRQISQDYKNKDLVLLGVLKGCLHFISDLSREIETPNVIEFIKASSYGESITSSGNVKISFENNLSFSKKHVIIIEDIIDTGLTLNKIYSETLLKHPESLTVCSFLIKKNKHRFLHEIKYYGFEVGDEFLVGYGLDYNEKYRNLNEIKSLND